MRGVSLRTLAILAVSLTLVSAQQATDASLSMAESDDWGTHLVDANGASLYLYQKDEQGSGNSACVESCTRNWPPLTVEGEPVAGEGLDAELLSTIRRDDGSTQLTYNGWPLYAYARDAGAGDTKGAGLGGVFFLVSPSGEAVTEQVSQAAAEVDDAVVQKLLAEGQPLFSSNCAVCHGAQGQGVVGPGLAGNDFLDRAPMVVRQIVNGSPAHGMPPFGHLSDDQIAGIATFIRNSWGNEFGPTTPEQVAEYR